MLTALIFKSRILHYTSFVVGILSFLTVIFSGLAISYLRSVDPTDSYIESAYTSGLTTFITMLLFVIILVITTIIYYTQPGVLLI
jgi:uncharacterized membrane protein